MLKGWLPEHLEANDDHTLEEHREAFEEHFGEEVSTSTIGRAIAAMPQGGWPLKKVAHSLRARRGGQGVVAMAGFPLRRKKAGIRQQSGFNTSMTRLRARAPKGKRAYGKVPRNRGKNQTLIAAITLEGGMGAPMTVEGATDALAFEAYVEHFLAPSLSKGQVAVLEGSARTEMGQGARRGRGADVVFLPSYSPDLNPIEEAFSKIKQLVRKVGARVREALVHAIGLALAAVTTEDVAGWFAHAGYRAQDQPL